MRVRLEGVKELGHDDQTIYEMVVVDEDDAVTDGFAVDNNEAGEYLEFAEQGSAPAAPAANSVRLYAEDNGSGKTRIVAKFASGANVVLGTQA